MNSVRYKVAEPNDNQSINDFYNRYYHNDRTIEQFTWEFVDCPDGPGIYIMAVDEHDNIIGIQAGIPIVMITSDGQSFLTIKSEDSLIDLEKCSKYKGKDIFKALYSFFMEKCKEREAVLIWGFTHAESALKRVGLETPFETGQQLLILQAHGGS